MSSHTLIHKSDRFVLTQHIVKNERYYKIDLNLKYRFWTDENMLVEYDTILNQSNRTNKFGWKYDTLEDANAQYTWAVVKWGN